MSETINPDPSIEFATGGTVQARGGIYISRPADEELLRICKAGEFAYVLACRQIGKSSLMNQTAERLSQAGVRTARIDLNGIGRTEDADSWYLSFIDEMARSLGLKIDVQAWWEAKSRLTLTRRFLQFLHDVVLEEFTEPVVIFVDEIDMTLGLDFADNFFAAIRAVYNDRAQYPAYGRLTFVLLGVATPDELIQDDSRTPFNIGRPIILRDFTKEECVPFQQVVEARYPDRQYFDQIYTWINGHPYLTQKLCKSVIDSSKDSEPDLVERLVTNLFLSPTERWDDNLNFVQSRVRDDRHARDMLSFYKQVLQEQEPVADDEKSVAINRLKLYGLVVVKNGQLRVRNKLYAQAFDLTWVEKMLDKIPKGPGLPARYKIVQEIGRGGFATIYLAEDGQMADEEGRNVALKVLHLSKEFGSDIDKVIKRFEREATTVQALQHPNIIQIYETARFPSGQDDEQTLFIAMKYISGGTLGNKLRSNGPLRREEAIHIVQQIGAALTYAHEQGVIHRDVKPDNILLDTDYEPAQPILTDFGLVKRVAADGEPPLTTGPLGTARYMAPEQLAPGLWGQKTPTPATDIYALAITFFEMLAGQHPFEVSSDHKLTGPELISKHLKEPLPPLSSMAPKAGPFFDEVLATATAKNPGDRFATMADFITALEVANNNARQSQAAPLVEAARHYFYDDNLDKALERIDEALQLHPGDVEALRLRGTIKAGQNKLDEALQDYQLAYEQSGDPASAAGQDYLTLLKQVAQNARQQEDYQALVKHYEVLKQILDEGTARGASVQPWAETWAGLVREHYSVGDRAYTQGNSDNVSEVTKILEREIEVLQGLKAGPESKDLQEKLRSLKINYYYSRGDKAYAAGNPADTSEAIEVLEAVIQALQQLEAEDRSQDLQKKLRLLQINHHYHAGDKAYAAGSPADLETAINILEAEIQKLSTLGAESETRDLRHKLRLLQIKYHYTQGNQAYAEGKPADIIAAISSLEIEIKSLVELGAENEKQDLSHKLRLLRIKDHYGRADRAYKTGNPENIDEAIKILEEEIQILNELKAESESQDLNKKLKRLRVKKNITVVEAAIKRISAQTNGNDETITQAYADMDEAYLLLMTLEPENERWPKDRREKLREQAQYRHKLAQTAEKEHEYETALKHYRIILDLEQIKKCEGIAQELKIDLNQKIAELEKKADYEVRYQKIIELMEAKDHVKALSQLEEDFISKGIYEHREVAKWLWVLVYAKQNNGGYPPELTSPDRLAQAEAKLVETQKELDQARTTAANTTQELTERLNKLGEEAATTQAQLAQTQSRVQQLKRRREFNRLLVPISLFAALGAGGLLASQLQTIPGLSIIALALLVVYFIYYVWAYYLS